MRLGQSVSLAWYPSGRIRKQIGLASRLMDYRLGISAGTLYGLPAVGIHGVFVVEAAIAA
jgi:hypothetical protein